MDKIRVLSIFGTRPEAIKMAPLLMEFQENREKVSSIVCVTAQHRQMLDQVLSLFNIVPDYDLNLMKDGQTLISVTKDVLSGLNEIMNKEKPDIVLVHGDTTTTLAAGMAAFYNKIPIGHVEAGLRTYNRYSPFPEEINRQLISRLAQLHFCPTSQNAQNLRNEGIGSGIYITGNTVIDALHRVVRDGYAFKSAGLLSVDFSNMRTLLLTAHRREISVCLFKIYLKL
jgi:UDP-N-acetylglucosamine 2-epimerase